MSRRMVVGALVAGLLLSFAPGHAGVMIVRFTCLLSGKANFSPGAKLTAQTINYSFAGNLTSCKSQGVSVKSATVTATGRGKFSCATGSSVGTATIRWNTGQISGVSFTANDTAALVRLAVRVTSGFLSGITFQGALAFKASPIGCIKGLPSANFNGLVTTG